MNMNTVDTRDRVVYLDVLRIIATFAVVMLHVSAGGWLHGDINSVDWKICNFYNSTVRFGVPVFTMISGTLFLGREMSVERIYRKNIRRIVTAFVFWSFLYAVALFYSTKNVQSSIVRFFTGEDHLWFLFMIVGLYMITPFLRRIVSDNCLTRYFLILALLFAFILPQLISVIRVFVSDDLGGVISGIVEKMNMKFVMGYTFYFILGYCIENGKMNRKIMRLIYLGGVVGFFLTNQLTVLISRKLHKPDAMFYDNFALNVLLESVFVFVVCKEVFSYIVIPKKWYSVIGQISKHCFGIYLMHELFIKILSRCAGMFPYHHPMCMIPLLSVAIFLCSLMMLAFISHVPILNKYIV